MKRIAIAIGVAVLMQMAVAAPAANRIPVADGFADWNGVVEKKHVAGRTLTPSDLRHRVVIVTEVDCRRQDGPEHGHSGPGHAPGSGAGSHH